MPDELNGVNGEAAVPQSNDTVQNNEPVQSTDSNQATENMAQNPGLPDQPVVNDGANKPNAAWADMRKKAAQKNKKF